MGWSGDSKQVTEALPKCDSVSPDRKTLRQGVDLRPRVRVAGNTHNLKAPSRSLTRPDFRRAPRRRYSPRPSHDIAVNTGLPMVALKLTQKHFGRPVSRLNFQEPLRQEESPKTWDPCRRQVKSLDSVHEIVLHQEDKLEFLDFYNEKSNREPILRRRKSVAAEYVHRQMLPEKLVLIDAKEEEVKTKTNQQEVLIPGSVLQSASVDKSIASHMKESDVIDGFKITIQGRKGGLWLHDTSYDNFCNIAMRLVARDMDEIGIAIVEDFYVIIEHQKNIVPADTFRVNVMTGKRQYDTEILHAMRRPEVRIWVSKQILSRSDDLTTEITSKNLKVVAPDIGYYYAFVGAKFKDFNTKQISDRFVRSALRCLFSLGETEVSRIGIFMMPGIGLGGHVIDLSYDVAIDEKIQKTFGRIMSSEEPGVEHYENHPTEVIIYKEPFYRIGPPDGTSYFDYSPPINFATFLNTTKFALYPNVRNSQKWQFFIVPNTEAWEKGIIIGPIDEFGCMRNLNMTTTVLEDLDECREIPWSKGKLIDAKKWNEWKRMNFFPDEAVRLIRCFEFIRGRHGTELNSKFNNFDFWTAGRRDTEKFNFERFKQNLGIFFCHLLDIDDLGERGIKVLVDRYDDDTGEIWLLFHNGMSALEFFQEFLKLKEDTIDIYLRDEKFDLMLHKEQLRLELINQGSSDAKEQPPNKGASSQRISEDGERGSQENLDNLNLEDERLGSEFDEDGIYKDNVHELGNTTPEEKPTWNIFISGGPDTPGIYPRILTVSEGNALKLRIKRLEDEILQREENCRVCGITFEDSVFEVRKHYKQHAAKHLCPYCLIDWTKASNEERIGHLIASHTAVNQGLERQKCPADGCLEDFTDIVAYPTMNEIFRHFQAHSMDTSRIIPSIVLPAVQQGNQELGIQEGDQQGKPDDSHLSPQRQKQEHRPMKDKGLYYHCSKCLKNVNSLSLQKQEAHVQECETTLDTLLTLPPAMMKKLKNKREEIVTKSKQSGSLTVPALLSSDLDQQEGESSSKGQNKKRTRRAKPSAPRKKTRQ